MNFRKIVGWVMCVLALDGGAVFAHSMDMNKVGFKATGLWMSNRVRP